MSLLDSAFLLASELHKDQRRKASIVPGVPYMSHLMEVAGMVSACGGDETTTAAALLHDVLEDVGAETAYDIASECGDAVLDLVQECTEIGTGIGGEFKAPWKERKEAYLRHLAHVSPEALLISVADKLHYGRELKRQVRIQGDKAYEAFAKKEYATIMERKHAVIWFHRELLRVYIARYSSSGPGTQALITDFEEVYHWLKDY